MRSEIEKCLAAGMNGFIPKPFKLAELFGPIYRAISGQEAAVFSESKISHQEKKNGRLVDWNILDENAAGDDVRRKRFLELFIEKMPSGLATLSHAMESHDLENIRMAAHSMKPQLLFTGITAAADLIERIEAVCLEKKNTMELPSLIDELESLCITAMEEVKEKTNQGVSNS